MGPKVVSWLATHLGIHLGIHSRILEHSLPRKQLYIESIPAGQHHLHAGLFWWSSCFSLGPRAGHEMSSENESNCLTDHHMYIREVSKTSHIVVKKCCIIIRKVVKHLIIAFCFWELSSASDSSWSHWTIKQRFHSDLMTSLAANPFVVTPDLDHHRGLLHAIS